MSYNRSIRGRGRGTRLTYISSSSSSSSSPAAPVGSTWSLSNTLRVGILGPCDAARRVWAALHAAGHKVVAVGANDLQTAAAFITACGAQTTPSPTNPAALSSSSSSPTQETVRAGTCEDVSNAREVDVVYVALPMAERDRLVSRCIRQRKHILLSPPAAPSAVVLQRWLEIATPMRILLAEETTLEMPNERLTQLKASFGSNSTWGSLRAVRVGCGALFTQLATPTTIPTTETITEGVLGEMGWRVVTAVLELTACGAPFSVLVNHARHGIQTAVVTELNAELLFPPPKTLESGATPNPKAEANQQSNTESQKEDDGVPDVTVSLQLSSAGPVEQCLTAYGTHGVVTLHDLLLPSAEESHLCTALVETVEGPPLRRTLRRESVIPVLNPQEDRDVGRLGRRLREALGADAHGGGMGMRSAYNSGFRGDTQEGVAATRRMWAAQVVLDALHDAVEKSNGAVKEQKEGI